MSQVRLRTVFVAQQGKISRSGAKCAMRCRTVRCGRGEVVHAKWSREVRKRMAATPGWGRMRSLRGEGRRSRPGDELHRRQVDQGGTNSRRASPRPGRAAGQPKRKAARKAAVLRLAGGSVRAIRLADAAPSSRWVTARTTMDMLGKVLTSPAHLGLASC